MKPKGYIENIKLIQKLNMVKLFKFDMFSSLVGHRNAKAFILQMVENLLKTHPKGEDIFKEYDKTKTLLDAKRRLMVNILVADMIESHGYEFLAKLLKMLTFIK